MARDDVQVRVLGAVALEGGRSAEAFGPRLRRLLARLVVGRNEIVTESALVEAVWGDELPADPGRSLQVSISRLRGHLGSEAIERAAPGYRLRVDALDVDAAEFERLLTVAEEGRARADDRSALDALDGALGLWSGSALVEFADEAWALTEAHRLDELRVAAQEQRAELLIGLDDVSGALVAELETLAAGHPHREGPTRLLMVALHSLGRQADALAAFARHRDQLATDLGLSPSDELQTLEESILLDEGGSKATTAKARPLRGYQIAERMGEGAFSIVYRGSQPSVGRDVAIKQIRAELANRPEFIRRFETEAHLVARLEHPHIVPLFDYWREPGSAYLVMRLLRGGNLESSLLEQPWPLPQTVGMVEQIGAALSTAHRAGVVHRDVKSANILLDDEGNAYLSDFGIALEAAETGDPEASLSAGSPAYASPEQLQRQAVGPPSDVHGLAIVVYEVLCGRLPFPDEPNHASLLQRQLSDPIPSVRATRADVPTAVDHVLQKATAKVPANRYATAAEFVDAFRGAVDGVVTIVANRSAVTALGVDARNPYKGLRAFDQADAADFAGRDRLVDQLVETLERHRLIAVVGPSGSGKSSVVRAGLLPELQRGRLTGSDDWFVVTMLPGGRPFEELEDGLVRVAADPPLGLLDLLRDGERGVGRAIRRVLPEHGRLLLVIDQFEELFTLCDDEADRRQFLDALASAVTEERSRLRVVLTLRADFYDRPLRYESVGRLLRDATVPVLPLAADEIERAIVDPALAVGCELEPGLVSEIVADLSDQPGALPMLQYALTELYERRVSDMLTRTAYGQLGGVAGTLARRAEELFEAGSDEEQAAARPVFGRLVSPGEGTEDTRRRASRSELCTSSAADAVIDRYGEARLLTFDNDPTTREPTVEVAHEALIREWPRLRGWLDEDRESIRLQRHLGVAADEWEAAGRPSSELYRGGRLESAEEWVGGGGDPTDREADFLTASVEHREAERVRDERTNRRLRRFLVGVTMVAVVALIAGAVAFQQRSSARRNANEARTQTERAEANASAADDARAAASDSESAAQGARDQAELRRMMAEAALQRDSDPTLSFLLAAEAARRAPGPETDGSLLTTLQHGDGYLGFVAGPGLLSALESSATFVGEDHLLVRTIEDITVYDLEAGTVDASIASRVPAVHRNRPAVAGSGGRAIVTTEDGRALLFEADSPAEPLDISAGASVTGVGLGAGGAVVLGHGNGEVELRSADLRGSQVVGRHPYPVVHATVSADGGLVASADTQANVTVWDMATGEARWTWTLGTPERWDPSIDPVRAVSDGDGNPLVYGLVSGGPPTLEADRSEFALKIRNLWFSADGRSLYTDQFGLTALDLASGSIAWNVGASNGGFSSISREIADGTVVYGNLIVRDGEVVRELRQFASIAAVVPSPSGRHLVEVGVDGLSIWSNDGAQLIAEAVPRRGHDFVTLSPDGERVASFLYGVGGQLPEAGSIRTVDDGRQIAPDDAWFQVFTTNGDFLSYYVLPGDLPPRTPVLRDAETFEAISAPLPPQAWSSLEISPDRRFVAIGDIFRPEVRVYDAETAELVATLGEPLDQRGNCGCIVAFAPDSSVLVAVSGRGGLAVWNTETWEAADYVEPIDGDSFGPMRFEESADHILLSDDGGDIFSYDFEERDLERITTVAFAPQNGYHTQGLAASPGGEYLVAAGTEGAALVHRDSGTVLGRVFESEAIILPSASYDGGHLVTSTDDHFLIWDLDPDGWLDIACRAAGRNMTSDEWDDFGPANEPYRATCPRWPSLAVS